MARIKVDRGLLICIEGGEGTGKTTLGDWLCERMSDTGRKAVCVADPGSTKLAQQLRKVLLDAETPMTAEQQLLLFTAARSALAAEIKEHLAVGTNVITCRWVWSTVVYQGTLGGLDGGMIKWMHEMYVNLDPDIYVLLDCDPVTAMKRKFAQKGKIGVTKDRFESQTMTFHKKIRDAYLVCAKQSKAGVIHTDSLTIPECRTQLIGACMNHERFRANYPMMNPLTASVRY